VYFQHYVVSKTFQYFYTSISPNRPYMSLSKILNVQAQSEFNLKSESLKNFELRFV
jgi:hypothetical protein